MNTPATTVDRKPPVARDPEYVLVYNPPYVHGRIWDRLTKPGFWELLTVTDYDAGIYAGCDLFTCDGSRRVPADRIAGWAAWLLGYPVTIDPDATLMKVIGRFTRWHAQPFYWVRRAA